MKIFANKLFIIVSSIILILFSIQFYYLSSSYKRDVNSYVTLVKWAWTLTRDAKKSILKVSDKNLLKTWDIVSTIWSDSLAVIQWWDKSITRLWWNSRIEIKENFVWQDLSKINISFELLKWKTWSNVVTVLWEDSHFKEEINGTVAAVRWTVFEWSYDWEYVKVVDHEVQVTNDTTWESKKIYSGETLSLKNFNVEVIKEAVDKAWEDLNKSMDKEYFSTIQKQLLDQFNSSNPFKNIANNIRWTYDENYKAYNLAFSNKEDLTNYLKDLSEDKKALFLEKLKTVSQSLNFEKWDNETLYNAKLNTKETLIENTTDETYKQTLLKYTVYDLNSFFENNSTINKKALQSTLDLLNTSLWEKNQDLLKNINSKVENIMNWATNEVKDKIINSVQTTKDLFNSLNK